jgi:hypothetical protein
LLGLCWRTLGLRLSIGRRTCGGNEFACQRLSHRFTYSYTHCRCKYTPPFTVTTIHGVSSNVCTCTVPFALQHNISLLHTRLKNGQRRCLRHESTCARSYRCHGPEPGHSRIASFPMDIVILRSCVSIMCRSLPLCVTVSAKPAQKS